jgi:hypothetical protein
VSEYRKLGIDYDTLDTSKRSAIQLAELTWPLLAEHGARAAEASRGASAFVFALGSQRLALVVEGLGTKAMVARQFLDATGEDRFGAMAYDTVAAIVNDLCSVGALPLVVNAYFSTGDAEWLEGGPQFDSLVRGWRRAICSPSRVPPRPAGSASGLRTRTRPPRSGTRPPSSWTSVIAPSATRRTASAPSAAPVEPGRSAGCASKSP